MKEILLFLCLIAFYYMGISQINLNRQVISSTGAYLSSNSRMHMGSTVGEPITETISSINGSFLLLQGFQQPVYFDKVADHIDIFKYIVDYQIFPNPTTESITVRIESGKNLNLSIQITDLMGRELGIPKLEFLGSGMLTKQVNISTLAEGTYFLTFIDQENRVLLTEKIQKL